MNGVLTPPRAGGAIGATLALTGRHLRRLRRSPGKLVGITLNPLVMLFAFGVLFTGVTSLPPGTGHLEYVFAGAVVQVGLASIGPTAVGIAVDMQSGLVDRFRSLPIRSTAVLIGHTLADLVVGVIGIAAVTLAGLVMGWHSKTDLPHTLAGFGVAIAFVYAMLWLGLVLGLTMRNLAALDSVAALGTVMFSFLSTAFVPAGTLPSWLAPIAEWNPLSTVVSACRTLWGDQPGNAPRTTAIALTVLAATLAVALFLGIRAFRASNR